MTRLNLVEAFGHSQNTGYGTAGPECSWPELAAVRLGAALGNYASNGLVLAGDGNGYAKYLRPAAALRNRPAAPYLPPVDATVFHVGLGDLAANYRNNGVYTRGAFETALRAVIAFARLAAYFDAEPAGGSHASIAYGGSWTDTTTTDRNTGAGARATFTQGATLTITVPADFPGGEINLFWLVPGSGNGGTWTIAITGATNATRVETITAKDADQVTTTKYNVKATRLQGLNPGAHTITATLTSVLSFGVLFDGWGIRADPAPDIYLAQQPRLTQANYDAWLAAFAGDTPTDAAVDDINRTIADLAATEGAQYVELPDLPLNPSRWTVDGAHPNEAGCQVLADTVLAELAPPARPAARRTFTPTFGASWGNDAAPYANVAARRTPPRRVVLSGRAKRTGTPSTGETILTLPEGLWPGASHAYTCPGSTGTPVVTVAADGTVKYTAGSLGAAGTIDLDGIEWTVGQ